MTWTRHTLKLWFFYTCTFLLVWHPCFPLNRIKKCLTWLDLKCILCHDPASFGSLLERANKHSSTPMISKLKKKDFLKYFCCKSINRLQYKASKMKTVAYFWASLHLCLESHLKGFHQSSVRTKDWWRVCVSLPSISPGISWLFPQHPPHRPGSGSPGKLSAQQHINSSRGIDKCAFQYFYSLCSKIS